MEEYNFEFQSSTLFTFCCKKHFEASTANMIICIHDCLVKATDPLRFLISAFDNETDTLHCVHDNDKLNATQLGHR